MKPGESVTKAKLDAATLAVRRELSHLGFWNETSRLRRAEVFWCPLPQLTMPDAHGFFFHATTVFHRLLRFEAGHIYIPRWVLFQGPWGQNRGSLRDVIRHEYAHAVAHYFPSLIGRAPRFRSVFGGRYSYGRSVGGLRSDFVSDYATTEPAEDFAETFMLYVRHKGNRPPRFHSRAIKRKWQFVASLATILDSGRIKW